VEEWQRRQRAEKEKDRQQKQATAELLSGYRASELDAEALKLKEIREQERLKRQEAEATLRNFKKLEEPLHKSKSTSAKDDAQKRPVPVNAGGGGSQHNEDDNIPFGSVSALKANFNDSSFSQSQHSASSSNNERITSVALPMEALPPLADTVPPFLPGEVPPTNAVPTVIFDETAAFVDKKTGKEHTASLPVALPPTVTFCFGIITNNINSSKSDDGSQTVAQAYRQGLATVLQTSVNAIRLQSVTRDTSFPSPALRYIVKVQVVLGTADTSLAPSTVFETIRSAIQNGTLWEASSRPYK
jgi:hypothetical protein